ncbi:MAG: 4-(cytidine 5'-diphospho)-2-C-methyl-D-erythritol kinase [Bacilli bacterium]|nr:4-(cytidine 5'-diphospho)-2-C-methyl-D-erythritol kinase [Bacilli bacterium]
MLFERTHQIVKSYAKINLSLKVLNEREDGYHNLETIMIPVELHDVIEIEKRPGAFDTFITCDDIGLANLRHNLCTKAVEAMRKEFGFKDNFNISIHKEIPFAAGMGGGSSNAAAVIESLISLLKIKTDPETIKRIALSLGADVPFFLNTKPALATSLGENLQQIPVKCQYHCLIVKPKQGLSTGAIFQICGKFEKENADTEKILEGLANDDLELIGKSMGNDLYPPAASTLPEVKIIVDSFKKAGFQVAGMTGSGSACFALSKDAKFVKEQAKHYKSLGYIVRVTKTMK